MGDLSGRRIVVPETRELGQLVRMLEERGADTVSCPMIAIRDAPDPEPVEAWLRRFAGGACDDLVLMTGEGLRRLLGFARRLDLESVKFLKNAGAEPVPVLPYVYVSEANDARVIAVIAEIAFTSAQGSTLPRRCPRGWPRPADGFAGLSAHVFSARVSIM